MEHYFSDFRDGILGYDQTLRTPNYDAIRLVYADWTASGRAYLPIEQQILESFLPYVANTHTDTNETASVMTFAYHKARRVISDHVGADEGTDILISSGSGMTGVVNKFQRILGLRLHESFKKHIQLDPKDRPVVFVTHMEHHSNHTSWLETIADVVVVPADSNGVVSPDHFRNKIHEYRDRKRKYAAVTACSNVTGITTPYMDIAEIIHEYDGYCFVDFACSAPYVTIDMHEDDAKGRFLDAIYFSPHKFLGGPGSSGILVFNKKLYCNDTPDACGGGTVDWTDPWGQRKYLDDIDLREDGGTPAFLQTIRTALCVRLKEDMGVKNIQAREKEILKILWDSMEGIPNLTILADDHRDRLGVISFVIDDLFYNLGVKILNDRFGIQTRGGCACAGTYGHYLLGIDKKSSTEMFDLIKKNDFSIKPGWIRLSIHPTHTDAEIHYIADAVRQLAENHKKWSADYVLELQRENVRPKNMMSRYIMNSAINRVFEEKLVDATLLEEATL